MRRLPARCRARRLPRIRRRRSARRQSCKLFKGETPDSPTLTSSCYSLIAPDYAISQLGTFRPDGRSVRRACRRGDRQSGRRLRAVCGARRRRKRPTGTARSPARCSDETRLALSCLRSCGAPTAHAQEVLRRYEVVGNAIPKSLDRREGRCRARARHRGEPAGWSLSAVPHRPVSGRAVSRAILRPICAVRARVGRRANSACGMVDARVQS